MRRNSVVLFTEEELRAALMLTGTPDSARAVAAELYALPEDEQVHYHWIDTTLMLLSCVSDDLARRVLENFGDTPESRARHEAGRERGRHWIIERGSKPGMVFELADVVHDTREDSALMKAFLRDTSTGARHANHVSLFTEPELRSALSLCADAAVAGTVAAGVYGLSPERQATLDWTDFSLGLLSCVSVELAERVASSFGNTAERLEHIHELQGLFRELIDGGDLAGAHVSFDTVVHPRDRA